VIDEQPIDGKPTGNPARGNPSTGNPSTESQSIESPPTESQPADSDPPDDQKPKRRGSFWRELPILLGIAIVVAIVVRAFVLQTFYIPSESMQHTLEINDRVLVNKVIYHLRDPARGEIVVFEAPADWRSNPADEDFIKRVIAVGGDTVACCDEEQRLLINDVPLDEPYLYSQNGVSDAAAGPSFEVVVPEGRLWVLGDHRSSSGDSMDHYQRSGGDIMAATISVDAVIGRAFVLFWPPSRATWLSVPGSFDTVPDSPPE
jgi:signal peptidase I